MLSTSANAKIRSELHRYTLLHDRNIIDSDLKRDKYSSFFDIEANISSGLKKLIADAKSGSKDSSASSAQKILNMTELLSKFLNTEKFVEIDATAGIPMPDIKWNSWRLYPSIFYNINLGVSLSINNEANALDPDAQTYVKKDTKIGAYFILEDLKNKTEQWKFSLYKLDRADTAVSVNGTTLATDEGKLFNFDDLSQNHSMFATDIAFHKLKTKYQYVLEVKEFQLYSLSSARKSLYGTSPLLHARYRWNLGGNKIHWSPMIGEHYRKNYTLMEGLYVGLHMNYKGKGPVSMTTTLSNQFINFYPQFSTSFFKFSYGLKVPHRNPQDNFWVGSIHTLNINIPFP